MSAGTRIRAERKRQKLSLKELSKRANISLSFLCDIEKERSRPSLLRLIDISKALNKNAAFFLEDENIEEDGVFTSVREEDSNMKNNEINEVRISEKVLLTLDEAAKLTGIGVNKLHQMSDSMDCDFVIWNGIIKLLKRVKLIEHLENRYSI